MLKQSLATPLPPKHDETRALLSAVTDYSPETGTHLRRVCSLSVRLARCLGVTGAALDEVRYGALLHDIGKQMIPSSILHKPAKLDAAELVVMRSHSQLGADLAARHGFGEGVRSLILHHHERYDGDGYPHGLAGEDIPLGARVLAVVDTVDTIMHERSYDPARSYEIAQSEVLRCSGAQFDPRIAAVFLELLESVADKRGWVREVADGPGRRVTRRPSQGARRRAI